MTMLAATWVTDRNIKLAKTNNTNNLTIQLLTIQLLSNGQYELNKLNVLTVMKCFPHTYLRIAYLDTASPHFPHRIAWSHRALLPGSISQRGTIANHWSEFQRVFPNLWAWSRGIPYYYVITDWDWIPISSCLSIRVEFGYLWWNVVSRPLSPLLFLDPSYFLSHCRHSHVPYFYF